MISKISLYDRIYETSKIEIFSLQIRLFNVLTDVTNLIFRASDVLGPRDRIKLALACENVSGKI